ncbi:MAG: thiamine pyrophosphate-dependent dehydrogenase E1 component subunit alpha [Alphaproteobacteria bacterium]|nr:thiamine pyrophosphate-dependent dehydrogenase E1 component subunit alpha [Alphaproteobacteria bacterium]
MKQGPAVPSRARSNGLPARELRALYGRMLLIRRVEEQLGRLFADGEIPGFIHLSIGQEAVAAGVGAALEPRDTAASTHRGHGHAIAKGVDLDRFFLELLGKQDGLCRGRGGSMHVADLSIGMLGANGIVGAGLPIAVGSAIAHQVRKTGAVAVAFFGDGALAEGAVHESLNLAALWKLPFLAVCENNGWGEFSPTDRQLAATLEGLAAAYNLPWTDVDGNDVEAVTLAARHVVAEARAGRPQVLECRTTRVRGHFEGDPQKYRSTEEASAMAARDPLAIAVKALAALGVGEASLQPEAAEIDARIAAAVARARAGALPGMAQARAGVYA